MNATAAKPLAAKPAPPPDAIPAARPDAAACAQSLRVEGTLPAAQWGTVLDALATEIERRNGVSAAKRASATTKRWVGAVMALVAAGAAGFFLGFGFAIGVFVAGAIAAFVLVRMPPVDVIGAFPPGLLGELADPSVLPEARLVHVARPLRWDSYRDACPGTPRRYDATFAVEALTPSHAAFLEARSRRVERLSLAAGAPVEIEEGAPWLVSHSGADEEIVRLRAFAEREIRRRGERARIVVRSPRQAEVHHGPCGALVTACGFNSMLEGAALGERHLFLPLARRYDHQPLRAARRRRELREARS